MERLVTIEMGDLVGPWGEVGPVGTRGAVAFYDLTTNSEIIRVPSLCQPTALVELVLFEEINVNSTRNSITVLIRAWETASS